MSEYIFDKRRLKTFSNCKDLVKSMVGTRDGVIFYNEKFRLDLENTCYKASVCEDLQQENEKLKEDKFKLQARADRYKCKLDLYKDVIEEVKEYIEKECSDLLIGYFHNRFDTTEYYEKLLQILDKGESNERRRKTTIRK